MATINYWMTIAALGISGLICTAELLAPGPLLNPAVAVAREGTRLKITFSGTLESASAVSGPWVPLTNAVNPLLLEPAANQGFYRTRGPEVESIFAARSVVDWVLAGPLQKHFELAFAGTPDGIFPPHRDKPYFDATLTMAAYELPVSLRVRGNSSLQECPFPKLKLKVAAEHRVGTPLADAREIKIGSHCAEGGRGNIGRLRDERATFREALVYETMDLMGFVSPRVRRARIEYRDTTPPGMASDVGWQVRRQAVLLEDIEVTAQRLGGRALTEEQVAALTKAAFDEQLITELHLFHALTGNWDYALSPGGEGLRNTDVIELPNGQLIPVAGDFDLAAWVTGEVRASAPRDYRPDLAEIERQALYDVEQTQLRVSTESFASASARFNQHRAAIETAIRSAEIDDAGRTNALRHVTAFFYGLTAVTPTPR